MEIFNNLLRSKYIQNSLLLKELKLTYEEALILKYLIFEYLRGETSNTIEKVISEAFNTKSIKTILEKMPAIHSLQEKDYISVITPVDFFAFEFTVKNDKFKAPLLEQMKSTASLTSKILFILQTPIETLREKKKDKKVEILPYENSFQYLEDKFKKINFYLDKKVSKEETEQKVKEHNDFIIQRIEKTPFKIPLHIFLTEKEFSEKEEMVILAVLSMEYSLNYSKNFRNLDEIVNLLSFSTLDKLENRTLFRERSKLVQEKIFEFETSIHIVNDQKSFTNEELFISESFLNQIEGHEEENEKKEDRSLLKELVSKQELFELVIPKKDLDSVVLPKETRAVLDTIIKQLDKKVIDKLVKWGIKERTGLDARIIFHGVAGTGKTLTATAFAKTIDKEILHFDCSKVLSMYVGESEKNVRNIFDTYRDLVKKSGAEPILFLNEADQFLTSRSTDTSSSTSQMYNQMQNIFLEQIENFEGILIATTNLLDNLDKAFSRRFNYKVEFKLPSKDERIEIWKNHLPKNAQFEKSFDLEKLAEYKLSGGQIDLIIKNSAYLVATRSKSIFKTEDFIKEIEREKSSSFDGNRVMGFLK